MQSTYYKESIADAVKKLIVAREELFYSIFHIAMAGELYEWNRSVKIGEVHEFSTEIFEGFNDINIQLLTKLMGNIEDITDSVCNLNSLVV